jgi:hypothetical protein
MGLANTETISKKRKSGPQVGVSTLIQDAQDAEHAPPPPKKKVKASVEPSQPSTTTAARKRNNRGASSKTKRMDISAKKRPTGDESDDASVNANLAHPAKKAKVDEPEVLTRVPIRRSGKINLPNF